MLEDKFFVSLFNIYANFDFLMQEARNLEDFIENFKNDPTVKIPRVYKQLSGSRVLVMEWIDGIRCTDPQVWLLIWLFWFMILLGTSWSINNLLVQNQAIKDAGIDVDGFLTVGVSAALRQLLEFGLFHGDPHPGNIFAMRDGRIAYVDFGNVAVLSQVSFHPLENWMKIFISLSLIFFVVLLFLSIS